MCINSGPIDFNRLDLFGFQSRSVYCAAGVCVKGPAAAWPGVALGVCVCVWCVSTARQQQCWVGRVGVWALACVVPARQQ